MSQTLAYFLEFSILSCGTAMAAVTGTVLIGWAVQNISGQTFSLCLSTMMGDLTRNLKESVITPIPMAEMLCKALTRESQRVLGPFLEQRLGRKLRTISASSTENEEVSFITDVSRVLPKLAAAHPDTALTVLSSGPWEENNSQC